MKTSHTLPVLMLLVLLFGGLPRAYQFLFELTIAEGHGREFKTPVIMYSTRWCPYCHRARSYFERHGFSYVEYDIEASEQHLAEFRALNGAGVPLILMGNQRMQGFSPASFEDLLGRVRGNGSRRP
jgi:glutaredoxin